ncbi:MAG TPA: hypothetical protein VGN34_05065 [Ktedonobacteraceae bacterium]
MSSPTPSTSTAARRSVVTIQDNRLPRERVNSFAVSGVERPNNNASKLVYIEDPEVAISRLDKTVHSVSVIGWGVGTYPSNYQVCGPGEDDD